MTRSSLTTGGSKTPNQKAQVVVLGTGTPSPDPDRSGPAVAVVVNDTAYLVDCGPGVVRRAAAAARAGISALAVTNINTLFLTHLHSDHTLGYPDLIFTPWVVGRNKPLCVYGPRGLTCMTDHVVKAWKKDIDVRIKGQERGNRTGYKVHVQEISSGIVYRDANVIVRAFQVKHGSWDQAFGYRFETPGRTIVISGDTRPVESLVQAAEGCDILLHEVYNPDGEELRSARWERYYRSFHTSPAELSDIATRSRPRLLVIYHQLLGGLPEEQLVEQMRRLYSGEFIFAKDLGVY